MRLVLSNACFLVFLFPIFLYIGRYCLLEGLVSSLCWLPLKQYLQILNLGRLANEHCSTFFLGTKCFRLRLFTRIEAVHSHYGSFRWWGHKTLHAQTSVCVVHQGVGRWEESSVSNYNSPGTLRLLHTPSFIPLLLLLCSGLLMYELLLIVLVHIRNYMNLRQLSRGSWVRNNGLFEDK